VAGDSIAVGAGALDVVRRLCPTAWGMLTALAVGAEPRTECVVAHATVRSLAAGLGVNMDTVARALGRVRQDRLVTFVSGQFETGIYRLTIPSDVIEFDSHVPSVHRHPPRAKSGAVQMSLLKVD
jgi:hypothetical protein